LPLLDTLDQRTIAQDLSEFRFSSDPADLDFTFFTKNREDDDPDASFASHRLFVRGTIDDVFSGSDGGAGGLHLGEDDGSGGGAVNDYGGGEEQDFFTGDQAVGDFAPPGGFAPFSAEDSHIEGVSGQDRGVVVGMEPFDPRRAPNERDLVMAMTITGEGEDGEMLNYFDSAFMKNWAGPEHWKLRRMIKKRELPRPHFKSAKLMLTFTPFIQLMPQPTHLRFGRRRSHFLSTSFPNQSKLRNKCLHLHQNSL
jgi:condensin complex subunit 2